VGVARHPPPRIPRPPPWGVGGGLLSIYNTSHLLRRDPPPRHRPVCTARASSNSSSDHTWFWVGFFHVQSRPPRPRDRIGGVAGSADLNKGKYFYSHQTGFLPHPLWWGHAHPQTLLPKPVPAYTHVFPQTEPFIPPSTTLPRHPNPLSAIASPHPSNRPNPPNKHSCAVCCSAIAEELLNRTEAHTVATLHHRGTYRSYKIKLSIP